VTIAQHFKGLSEPTRLRMLNLLFQGELCGCDVQYVLELSQSNVSRHLNYLKRVGLVLDRRDGYRVFYKLADASDKSRNLLLDYLRHVFAREAMFADDLKQLKSAIRQGACTVSERRPTVRKRAVGERRQTL
jgi:ArsR family transcriptional regulator, arsenate/arsenite/antimonite-responsive transcriptional repressor